MKFQEITTDHEWSEAIALRNIYNWTNPGTVAEARSFFERSRQDRNDVRFVGRNADEIVSYGCAMFNRNANDGTYWFAVFLDPHSDHAVETFDLTAQECVKRIQGFGGKRAMIESRGEYSWEKVALEAMGFSLDMKLPFSCLETRATTFELHPNVVSFRDFLDQNPEDGLHRLWRLEMDVAADMPLPFPFAETPFEGFAKFILDPEVDLTCKFIFLEDGELKGMSQLWPSKVDLTLAATGLTGVRRQYRREGVATKTKQHAIAWAKQQGIERIFTDNEENNPMYQLNLQLGFRHMFDYEVYSKTC